MNKHRADVMQAAEVERARKEVDPVATLMSQHRADVMAEAVTLSQVPWEAGARRSWAGGDWEKLQGEGADGLPRWLAAAA